MRWVEAWNGAPVKIKRQVVEHRGEDEKAPEGHQKDAAQFRLG